MSTRILVAGDNAEDVQLAVRLLRRSFDSVAACVDPLRLATEFDRLRPRVVILAFRQFEAAQRASLALYRQSREIASFAHRTVMLCGKDDLSRAYQLCCEQCLDDYVLFWPLTHDPMRLPMSVRLALRGLDASRSEGPPAAPARSATEPPAGVGPAAADTGGSAAAAPVGAAESAFAPPGPPQAQPELLDLPAPVAGARGRPAVLVVDDDPLVQQLLTHVLSAAGCDVHTAADSAQALERVRECRLDLVLMDVGLPDLDGIVTTRRIKALPQCAGLPVIMLTGHSQREVIMNSRDAGAIDFIVKPINRDTLLSKLARHVRAGARAP